MKKIALDSRFGCSPDHNAVAQAPGTHFGLSGRRDFPGPERRLQDRLERDGLVASTWRVAVRHEIDGSYHELHQGLAPFSSAETERPGSSTAPWTR